MVFYAGKNIDWAAIRAKLPYEVSDAAKAKREVKTTLKNLAKLGKPST
jgi:hypothetical protein